MKPFEEMTKAEKMKVLEEDYLERQETRRRKIAEKEQRVKRLKIHAYTWLLMLLSLILIGSFIAMLVSAVVSGEGKYITGAVIFGIIGFLWLYLITYCAIGD